MLAEVVHLSACRDDGAPYFMLPASAVARIMSRDEVCDVVSRKQGSRHGETVRRSLRGEDYGRVWSVVLEGYMTVLRDDARVATVSPFLELMIANLQAMLEGLVG